MTGSVMMARRLKCRHLVAFYSVLISLSICCCCAIFSPFYVHLVPHFPAHVNSLVDCCEGRKYTFGSDICCSGRCRPLRTVLVKGITIFKCCTRLVSRRATRLLTLGGSECVVYKNEQAISVALFFTYLVGCLYLKASAVDNGNDESLHPYSQ